MNYCVNLNFAAFEEMTRDRPALIAYSSNNYDNSFCVCWLCYVYCNPRDNSLSKEILG